MANISNNFEFVEDIHGLNVKNIYGDDEIDDDDDDDDGDDDDDSDDDDKLATMKVINGTIR